MKAAGGGDAIWLAIETSSESASVAVGSPLKIRAEHSLTGSRQHAAQLLPLLDAALADAGMDLSAIGAVIVSDGPGSFTGLRVGASVAKALARSRELELWTAPSLMVLAADAPAEPGTTVLALSNALRGEVYAAAYRFRLAGVETVLAPRVYRPRELAVEISSPRLVVGALPRELETAVEEVGLGRVTRPAAGGPRAAALLALAGRPGGARRVEDLLEWEPDYGRPAEAQARWERTHGRVLPSSPGARR